MTNESTPRPGGSEGTVTAGEAVPNRVTEWADAYEAAKLWVRWTGRRRYPDAPTNDEVWAMSIASWWCGP